MLPAPRIDEVLPALLEFIGDAVIVGHNIRFDISFLDAALVATSRPRLANRHVDTLAIARRLVRDEVPNLRLSTLARHFRVPTEPIHRAFADAQATAEVLHGLLERAASFGVLGLDDLLLLPSMRAHPSAAKLALTTGLPRAPGVYLFRDRGGRVLYVGKATNLRSRVRSYFSTDDRRKVPQLLRETVSIDHLVCRGPFEAAVREIRLIQAFQPRFNRQAKVWRKYAYLKLTNERFPRLAVTRSRQGRRRDLPRSAPVDRRRAPRAGGDRVGGAAAPLPAPPAAAASSPTTTRAVRPRAARRGDVPVPRPDRRRRATPSSSSRCGRARLANPRCCSSRSRRACASSPTSSASRRPRRRANGSPTLSRAISRKRIVEQLARRAVARRRRRRRAGSSCATDGSCSHDGPGGDARTSSSTRRARRTSRSCAASRARRDRRAARHRPPSRQRGRLAAPRARGRHLRVGAADRAVLRDERGRATGRRWSRALTLTVRRRAGASARGRAPPLPGPRRGRPRPSARLRSVRARRHSSPNTPSCTMSAVASAQNGKQPRDRNEAAPSREHEGVLELQSREDLEPVRDAEHEQRPERQAR